MSIFYTYFIPIFWLVFHNSYDINKCLTLLSFLFAIRTKSEALRQYEAKIKKKKKTNSTCNISYCISIFSAIE